RRAQQVDTLIDGLYRLVRATIATGVFPRPIACLLCVSGQLLSVALPRRVPAVSKFTRPPISMLAELAAARLILHPSATDSGAQCRLFIAPFLEHMANLPCCHTFTRSGWRLGATSRRT